jgi:hypothetical protein
MLRSRELIELLDTIESTWLRTRSLYLVLVACPACLGSAKNDKVSLNVRDRVQRPDFSPFKGESIKREKDARLIKPQRTSGLFYKLKGDLMATIKSALRSWMGWDHYPLELIVCLTCPIHPGIAWAIRRLDLIIYGVRF